MGLRKTELLLPRFLNNNKGGQVLVMETNAMEIGYELPPIVKKITSEGMLNYSARHGGTFLPNIHTDKNVARRFGFPDIVLMATQSLNYANELLFKVYREHWIKNSSIQGSFIKSVFLGDTLTIRGVVKEKNIEKSKIKLVIDIWSENTAGDKTMVGKAVVTIPEG